MDEGRRGTKQNKAKDRARLCDSEATSGKHKGEDVKKKGLVFLRTR